MGWPNRMSLGSLLTGVLVVLTGVLSLPGQEAKDLLWTQLAQELTTPTDRLKLHDGATLTIKPLSHPLGNAEVQVDLIPADPAQRAVPRKDIAGVEFFEERWLTQFDQVFADKADLEQVRAAEKLVRELGRQHRLWRVSPPRGKNPWQKMQERIEDRLAATRVAWLNRLIGQAEAGNRTALREAQDLGEPWITLGPPEGPLRQPMTQVWKLWGMQLLKDGQAPAAAQVLRRFDLEHLAYPRDLVNGVHQEAQALLVKARTTPGQAGDLLLRQAGELEPQLAGLEEEWDKRQLSALRIAVDSLPKKMSPLTASSASERLAVALLFDNLVQIGQGAVALTSFDLPKNVVWSDGRPLTAADVYHSLELLGRANLPGRTGFWREFLETKTSPHHPRRLTLLPRQGLGQDEVLARLFVLPQMYRGQALPRADDPDFAQAPVGTGPYRYVGRKEDKSGPAAVFRINPFYQRGSKPALPEIRLVEKPVKPIEAGATAPHLVFNLSPEEAAAWRKASYRLQYLPPEGSCVLTVNHGKPALANVNLRRALAQALDRKRILADYYKGQPPPQAQALNGPFRADSWAICPSPRIPADLFNVEAAQSFAKKARAESGAIELSLHFDAADPLGKAGCKAMAEQIEATLAGVRIKLHPVGPDELRDRLLTRQYALAYINLHHPEDLLTLWSLFDTQADALKPGGSNFLDYKDDAQLQILLRDLIAYRQFSVLTKKYHDLHAHLHERMPLIPLWQAPTLVAVHPSLQLPPMDQGPLFHRLAEWKLAITP